MPLKDPSLSYVPEPTVRAFRELRGLVQTELGLYVPRSLLGQPNGVATLDGAGKVVQDPTSFLPVTVRNAIQSCVVDASGAPDFLASGTGFAMTLIGPLTVSFSSGRREFVETIQDGAWPDLPPAKAITGVTRDGAVATYACTGHGFPVGGEVTIVGIGQAEYNGTKLITGAPDANHFTCTVSGTPATPGTISGDELAQPTVFLLVDRDPVTGAITCAHTLLPPNDDPVRPGSPVEDQHWFDPSGYVMYRYDGAAWVPVQRLCVGECVVDVDGIVAGSIVCYAPLAWAHLKQIGPAAGMSYSLAHNIGSRSVITHVVAECLTAEFGYSPGDRVPSPHEVTASGASFGLIPVIVSRRELVLKVGASGPGVFRRDTGQTGAWTAANWEAVVFAKRAY